MWAKDNTGAVTNRRRSWKWIGVSCTHKQTLRALKLSLSMLSRCVESVGPCSAQPCPQCVGPRRSTPPLSRQGATQSLGLLHWMRGQPGKHAARFIGLWAEPRGVPGPLAAHALPWCRRQVLHGRRDCKRFSTAPHPWLTCVVCALLKDFYRMSKTREAVLA